MKTIYVVVVTSVLFINGLAQERYFKIGIQLPEGLTKISIDQRDEPEGTARAVMAPSEGTAVGITRSIQSRLVLDDLKTSRQIAFPMIQQPPEWDNESTNPAARPDGRKGFDWKPALIQSGLFMAIQHGFRLTEGKTRNELDGPFINDWKASVKNLRGWDDGGKFFTNYVGHPMQGAITGRIFVNNSPAARKQSYGRSKDYWTSRIKAMAWSAVWSTQFELGPISEASLGNVGQKLAANGRSKMTYGDLVMTPVGGTGLLIAEDMIDKYVLTEYLEKRISKLILIKILRSVLTPMTGFANVLRGHAPWWRDDRVNSIRAYDRYLN